MLMNQFFIGMVGGICVLERVEEKKGRGGGRLQGNGPSVS